MQIKSSLDYQTHVTPIFAKGKICTNILRENNKQDIFKQQKASVLLFTVYTFCVAELYAAAVSREIGFSASLHLIYSCMIAGLGREMASCDRSHYSCEALTPKPLTAMCKDSFLYIFCHETAL